MNKFRSAIFGGDAPAPGGPLVSEKRGHDTDGDNLASVAVPRDAARTADHRDDDRHRLVQETASVRFQRKTHLVDLINLSGGGAMIGSDIKPRLWDRVDLILGEGGAIECAVRWIRGDRIGLEFAHETRIDCAPEQRDAVLLEVIRRSFPEICLAETSPPLENESNEADDSRRAAHRHPLIWNGQILWQHDSHNVRLRNISASGALIDTAIDFPSGAELLLDLGEGRQLSPMSAGRVPVRPVSYFATRSTCRNSPGFVRKLPPAHPSPARTPRSRRMHRPGPRNGSAARSRNCVPNSKAL